MGFEKNGKQQYVRMDSDAAQEEVDHPKKGSAKDVNNDSRKFVFACAIFASLNSVLLGYGLCFFILIFQCFSSSFRLICFYGGRLHSWSYFVSHYLGSS